MLYTHYRNIVNRTVINKKMSFTVTTCVPVLNLVTRYSVYSTVTIVLINFKCDNRYLIEFNIWVDKYIFEEIEGRFWNMCNILYLYILSYLQYLHHSTCILNYGSFMITQLSRHCKRYFHFGTLLSYVPRVSGSSRQRRNEVSGSHEDIKRLCTPRSRRETKKLTEIAFSRQLGASDAFSCFCNL